MQKELMRRRNLGAPIRGADGTTSQQNPMKKRNEEDKKTQDIKSFYSGLLQNSRSRGAPTNAGLRRGNTIEGESRNSTVAKEGSMNGTPGENMSPEHNREIVSD